MITINIGFLSISSYHDTANALDTEEFNELSYIEILMENSQLQLEEMYKDFASSLALYYYNLGRDDIFSNEIGQIKPDNITIEEYIEGKVYDPPKTVLYYHLSTQPIDQNLFKKKTVIFSSMFLYLIQASNYKIFGEKNKDENNNYYKHIIHCDFKLGGVFIYPGTMDKFNKSLLLDDVMQYMYTKAMTSLFDTHALAKMFSTNLDYLNLLKLPIFDEYYQEFPKFYTDEKYPKMLSFAIVTSVDNDHFTQKVYKQSIDQAFFVIGTNSSMGIIYDEKVQSIPGISLLRTRSTFPYKVLNEEYCYLVRNLNLDDTKYNQSLELNDLQYLDDCFNNDKSLGNYDDNNKPITQLSAFFNSFHLYDKTTYDIQLNSNLSTFIELSEKDYFLYDSSMYSQSSNLLFSFNGLYYKVKKAYAPLSVASMICYYYPITSPNLNFIFKNEGLYNNMASNIYISMTSGIITGLGWSLSLMIITIGYVIWRLFNVISCIQKPVDLLNETIRDIGKNEAGKDSPVEKYNKEKEGIIKEFMDLIAKIEEMIKGNIDLQQTNLEKEEIKYKLEEQKFNREFEMIKMHNIIVREDKIAEILEKSNFYSKKILSKTLKNIRQNSSIKNSVVIHNIFNNCDDELREIKGFLSNIQNPLSTQKTEEDIEDNHITAFQYPSLEDNFNCLSDTCNDKTNILYKDYLTIFKDLNESNFQQSVKHNTNNSPIMRSLNKLLTNCQ